MGLAQEPAEGANDAFPFLSEPALSAPDLVSFGLVLQPPLTVVSATEVAALQGVYRQHIRSRGGRGVDRMGIESFDAQQSAHYRIIQRKVRNGTYQFSPLLERLALKGRGRMPRVISVPTIRDKIVLHQVKELLHGSMPACVGRRLPNEYVRTIREFSQTNDVEDLEFFRVDIEAFYDKINHSKLFQRLESYGPDPLLLSLVRRAIRTPTVSGNAHRDTYSSARNRLGVPQGLAISNILANVYLHELDEALRSMCPLYLRYVDDILIFLPQQKSDEVRTILAERLNDLGLNLNADKTRFGKATHAFEYLGYSFRLPVVSVRKSNQERFIASIASMFAEYRYLARNRSFAPWLDANLRKAAFVDDLNERITGAISDNRRYGWLFFFAEITDQALLHRLDATIRSMFVRLRDFGGQAPANLKSLARTYFEIRYAPGGGYILDYNSFDTVGRRLDHLIGRGAIDPTRKDQVTVEEVEQTFENYKRRRLGRLERDVGHIS